MSVRLLRRASTSFDTFDVLIITALIWFLGKFIRYVFPPLFDSLQGTYTVSTTVLGWTFSAFLVAYAIVQFPSGILSDAFGTVWVISGGVILASLTALVLLFEIPFLLFVTVMVVLGVGTGVHKTCAVQLLTSVYPTHSGRALGVFDTFGTFGGVVAPVAVVVAASIPGPLPGWRILLFFTGVLGLLFAFSFITRVPRKLEPSTSSASRDRSTLERDSRASVTWSSYVRLFDDKKFTIFVISCIFFSFTYNGIVAFLPLYLIEEAGVSSTSAGILYSVLFVASLAQIGSGELSDRAGTLPVISGALALATLSMTAFILLTDSGLWLLAVSVLTIGLGAHSFRPVRGAYLMQTLPNQVSAGGFGIVRTLLMGAGAISPGVVGTVSDIATFRTAFWLLALSVSLSTILSLYLLYTDTIEY